MTKLQRRRIKELKIEMKLLRKLLKEKRMEKIEKEKLRRFPKNFRNRKIIIKEFEDEEKGEFCKIAHRLILEVLLDIRDLRR